MAKQGEKDYLKNIGEEGSSHAYNKPFSDANCGFYLRDIGIIMSLLPSPPAKLLDLGAGTGWTSCFFALKGYEVTSQDIAEDMTALAAKNKERYGVENMQIIACDYEALNYDNVFDAAVFYDSLHHAEDETAAIRAAFRSLKPGGVLITAEPGTGHADSEAARQAKELYGVTEKDMPPTLIIKVGKQVGFREFRVFDRPFSPTEIPQTISFRSIKGLAKKVIREHLIFRAMRVGNLVVMKK